MREYTPLEPDIEIENLNPTAYMICNLQLTLEAVHDAAFTDARLCWAPFTAYNAIEARAELATCHMDRCSAATRAFNGAFANWHASILLERHSEPDRWTEVERAHEALRAALADLHADFPDRAE